MNGVLVDVLTRLQQATRAYRESSTVDALDASYAVDEINNELGELLCPLNDRPDLDLSALTLPAQAAADAAGVQEVKHALHLASTMSTALHDLDALQKGDPARAVKMLAYATLLEHFRALNPARLRALADALEVQG